jgi:hypothetical protein
LVVGYDMGLFCSWLIHLFDYLFFFFIDGNVVVVVIVVVVVLTPFRLLSIELSLLVQLLPCCSRTFPSNQLPPYSKLTTDPSQPH